MICALTHTVSPLLNECQLSYLERESIDLHVANEQHKAYCQLLQKYGVQVSEISVNQDYPDGTFIEDTAVVLDEIAVMTRPGALSRRGEVEGVARELKSYRELEVIKEPGTLEGGDVLLIEKQFFVGLSPRTNLDGIQQLRDIVSKLGYTVTPVQLKDCLHLKSAVTALDNETVLVNPNWLNLESFRSFKIIYIDPEETWAANVLRLPDCILLPEGFDKTLDKVRKLGYKTDTVDITELQKAESALTCSSLIFKC